MIKKTFTTSLLAFFVVFLSVPTLSLFASEACLNVGYTISGINGVFTNEEGARNNQRYLRAKVGDYYKGEKLDYQYLLNPSHLGGVGDILKSVAQGLLDTETVDDYDLREMLATASEKVHTRKLLLVAHSQGNFYANSFYDTIAGNAGGVPRESIAIYSVANPASRVAGAQDLPGRGRYLTSTSDKVIAGLVSRLPFTRTLPANTTINLEPGDDLLGHNFASVYLKHRGAEIVAGIETVLGTLSIPQMDADGNLPHPTSPTPPQSSPQAGEEAIPSGMGGGSADSRQGEGLCISPPRLTLTHKAKGLAFAVADPVAQVVVVNTPVAAWTIGSGIALATGRGVIFALDTANSAVGATALATRSVIFSTGSLIARAANGTFSLLSNFRASVGSGLGSLFGSTSSATASPALGLGQGVSAGTASLFSAISSVIEASGSPQGTPSTANQASRTIRIVAVPPVVGSLAAIQNLDLSAVTLEDIDSAQGTESRVEPPENPFSESPPPPLSSGEETVVVFVTEDGAQELFDLFGVSSSAGFGGGGGASVPVVLVLAEDDGVVAESEPEEDETTPSQPPPDQGEEPEPESEAEADSMPPDITLSLPFCDFSLLADACLVVATSATASRGTTADDFSHYLVDFFDGVSTTTTSTIDTTQTFTIAHGGSYRFVVGAYDTSGNSATSTLFSWSVHTSPIRINEIAWAGTEASAFDEWLELKNMTSETLTLDNLILASVTDEGPSIALTGTIGPNTYYLLERRDDETVATVVADLVYGTGASEWSLHNDGEELELRHVAGEVETVIDRTPAVAECGGWCFGGSIIVEDQTRRITMQRFEVEGEGADGTDPASWEEYSDTVGDHLDRDGNDILGTPRAENGFDFFAPPMF